MPVKIIKEYEGKRKVKTRDGKIGVVCHDFKNGFCTIQTSSNSLYPVYRNDDLEDVSNEYFAKHFK